MILLTIIAIRIGFFNQIKTLNLSQYLTTDPSKYGRKAKKNQRMQSTPKVSSSPPVQQQEGCISMERRLIGSMGSRRARFVTVRCQYLGIRSWLWLEVGFCCILY